MADPQPQRPGDGAGQVTDLQRGRPLEQAAKQLQLAALGAGPGGGRDLVQGLEHHPDLQGGHPPAGPVGGQQLLGGEAEVAGLEQGGPHLLQGHPGAVGQGPGDHLVGQADLDPGEGGGDVAKAEVDDPGQQPVVGLAQQLGQPVDQRQPGADLLQVAVGGGHGLVLHRHSLRQAYLLSGAADRGLRPGPVDRATAPRSRSRPPTGSAPPLSRARRPASRGRGRVWTTAR